MTSKSYQEELMVRRVYVEKKPAFAIAAKDLLHEAKYYLHVEGIEDIRVFIRYDVENITDETYEKATRTVFAEPISTKSSFRKLRAHIVSSR